MNVWNEIEALLSRFENSEADALELRAQIRRIPPVLEEVRPALRKRAEELGAEAFYMAGELDRVVSWVGKSPVPGAALWLGHALFDLGRYSEALPNLRKAANQLPLQDWALLKVEELILCIRIHLEPGGVTGEDFERLYVRQQSLGVAAPIPVEIRRTLAQARETGSLPDDVLRRAQTLYGRYRV